MTNQYDLSKIIERIFYKIDKDHKGYIGIESVPELIQETYKNLKIDWQFNEEDINSWM